MSRYRTDGSASSGKCGRRAGPDRGWRSAGGYRGLAGERRSRRRRAREWCPRSGRSGRQGHQAPRAPSGARSAASVATPIVMIGPGQAGGPFATARSRADTTTRSPSAPPSMRAAHETRPARRCSRRRRVPGNAGSPTPPRQTGSRYRWSPTLRARHVPNSSPRQ
jgi:hypothetical protein